MRADPRLREVFEEALELDPGAREPFIRERCAGNVRLGDEVGLLLSLHERSGDFLEQPLARIAAGDDPDEAAALRPGDRVGAFRVLCLLGEGGMGAVYLAEQDMPVRRHVALKVVKRGMDTRDVLRRFELESQALARMDHPGIARIYGSGSTADGRPFFAMEYVDGVPLLAYCDGQRLTIARRLRLFLDVCDAVQHAHQKGIIHRDLKPSNVLVATRDGQAVQKVIDFGVAKAVQPGGSAGATLATSAGWILGTPEYMSPEQAGATGSVVDTRSDIYSLGVVLYQLLSGNLPRPSSALRGRGPVPLGRVLLEEQAPALGARLEGARDAALLRSTDPRSLRRALRGELGWIVAKAIESDPARRYSSASELAAEIRRHLDGEPVLAGPPSAAYRLRKLVRRHRGLVLSVATVITLLAGGLALSSRLYVRMREARDLAERRGTEILRLSDGFRLERLLDDARALGSARPEHVPAFLDWERRAQELLEARASHRSRLEELRREGVPERTPEGATRWRFRDDEHTWLHGSLERLVARLDALASRDPTFSALEAVRVRRGFAERMVAETVEHRTVEWRAALEGIRANPLYAGLVLEPVPGLVPLGPDPHTRLFEFAHAQSGDPPERAPSGELLVGEETGIVLVLLPGGRSRLGAQGAPSDWPRDDVVRPDELPVHPVDLAPFLLSKCEVTQGQWLRLAHGNPSRYCPGSDFEERNGGAFTLRHPVERLTWAEAQSVLATADLELPTEAQWEYAARGGSPHAWWTGDDRQSTRGAVNVSDTRCVSVNTRSWNFERWLDDGFVYTAPVGCLRPNSFGLHDVVGNVWEWTSDRYADYRRPVRPGDGLRLADGGSARVARGGSWDSDLNGSRLSRRCNYDPGFVGNVGVRPARRLEP